MRKTIPSWRKNGRKVAFNGFSFFGFANNLRTKKQKSASSGKNPRNFYLPKGFTLLELLLVMAIVGIMTSVLLVYLGDQRESERVEMAARNIAAAIREAQRLSLSGSNFVENSFPCSFIFRIDGQTKGVVGYEYRTSSSACSGASGQEIYSFQIDSSNSGVRAQFLGVGGRTEIRFSVPFGRSSIPAAEKDKILVSKGSRNITLCVSSTGMVEMKIGDVPC